MAYTGVHSFLIVHKKKGKTVHRVHIVQTFHTTYPLQVSNASVAPKLPPEQARQVFAAIEFSQSACYDVIVIQWRKPWDYWIISSAGKNKPHLCLSAPPAASR